MRKRRLGWVLALGVALVLVGMVRGGLVGALAAPDRTTLADVAAACADGDPGIAVVAAELRDANTSVNLPDCVIHLEDGADVTLNNVTITGGVINLHDRGTDASTNSIRFQKVTFDNAALLIELNDVEDSFSAQATSITTARGIGIRVAGTRDQANDGGEIRLVGSELLATDLDATIYILASDHTGTVRLVGTSIDTRGSLTVLAADCEAVLFGEKLDCSTATVSDELG